MAEQGPLSLPQKPFPVAWEQFHRDCRALAWRLSDAGPFAAIVCITRGGLVPAAIVARELGIRVIETVCVASYEHVSQGELKVLKTVAPEIVALGGGGGKGVLVVDDLLEAIAKFDGTVQTLGLGIADAEREEALARAAGQHGVDRIVKLGRMHVFSSPWDGTELIRPMVRVVRHVVSQE